MFADLNPAWVGGAAFPMAVGLGSSFTHCAGMCGPIHLFLASRGAGAGIWSYHAGRILGYALLGAAAGAFGGLLQGFDTPALKAAAGWILAGLYALFGIQLLGWLPRAFNLEARFGALFPSRWFGRMAASGHAGRWLFPAGLIASLLPCPSTHAVLLFGIGLANPWLSALAMLALGVATLPMFALVPGRRAAMGLLGRHYGSLLGIAFLGLSVWRIYGAASAGTPACH